MIKDKRKKIAIIYEGIKTEENLFKNLIRYFFADKTEAVIVTLPAAGNLYMLWTRLRADDFNTDVISVLKEMNADTLERLTDMDITDFSEIYLFFDYDGHHNNIPRNLSGNDALDEMLKTFNNETELGKLYVSYPMVESIKEIAISTQDYKTFYLPLEECGNYKQIVGNSSDYSDFRHITKEMWYIACNASRKRASIIVTCKEEKDYNCFLTNMTQENIYLMQKNTFINENKVISILNSIPLFLLEYYDESFWNKVQAVKSEF